MHRSNKLPHVNEQVNIPYSAAVLYQPSNDYREPHAQQDRLLVHRDSASAHGSPPRGACLPRSCRCEPSRSPEGQIELSNAPVVHSLAIGQHDVCRHRAKPRSKFTPSWNGMGIRATTPFPKNVDKSLPVPFHRYETISDLERKPGDGRREGRMTRAIS